MAFLLRVGDECMIANDFTVEGRQAFARGEIVKILEISPDRLQPGNKYVVHSEKLGRQARLPGAILHRASCPYCHERLKPNETGGFSDICSCGWADPETSRYRTTSEDADKAIDRMQDRVGSQFRPPMSEDQESSGLFAGPEHGNRDNGRVPGSDVLMEKAVAWRNERMGLPTDVGDMCPVCSTVAALGKDRCPACNRNLSGVRFPDGSSVPAGEFFCPACHARLEADPLDCPSCGWHFKRGPQERAKVGYLKHDIVIAGVVAFRRGELVKIESESPDPERLAYRYVVHSQTLSKKFRLSDTDLDT